MLGVASSRSPEDALNHTEIGTAAVEDRQDCRSNVPVRGRLRRMDTPIDEAVSGQSLLTGSRAWRRDQNAKLGAAEVLN